MLEEPTSETNSTKVYPLGKGYTQEILPENDRTYNYKNTFKICTNLFDNLTKSE